MELNRSLIERAVAFKWLLILWRHWVQLSTNQPCLMLGWWVRTSNLVCSQSYTPVKLSIAPPLWPNADGIAPSQLEDEVTPHVSSPPPRASTQRKPDLLLPLKDHVHAHKLPKLFPHELNSTCKAPLLFILYIEKYHACSSYVFYVTLKFCTCFGTINMPVSDGFCYTTTDRAHLPHFKVLGYI